MNKSLCLTQLYDKSTVVPGNTKVEDKHITLFGVANIDGIVILYNRETLTNDDIINLYSRYIIRKERLLVIFEAVIFQSDYTQIRSILRVQIAEPEHRLRTAGGKQSIPNRIRAFDYLRKKAMNIKFPEKNFDEYEKNWYAIRCNAINVNPQCKEAVPEDSKSNGGTIEKDVNTLHAEEVTIRRTIKIKGMDKIVDNKEW